LEAHKGFSNITDDNVHILLTNEMEELQFTNDELLEMHNEIHGNTTIVKFKGETYPVVMGKSGCRRVNIKGKNTVKDYLLLGITFIEQNKSTKSKYAKMANDGKKITWFIHNGKWGSIVDGRITDK
jgi:hypothetical protein